jgi:hypothetical protein
MKIEVIVTFTLSQSKSVSSFGANKYKKMYKQTSLNET